MVVKEQIGRVDYGAKHVFLYESRIKKAALTRQWNFSMKLAI